MDADFNPGLSPEDKKYLLDLARFCIDLIVRGQTGAYYKAAPKGALHEKYGAFVTLKLNGQLRGCIGRIISEDPLFVTVAEMAEAAAFHDNRFSPVTLEDLTRLEVEVSIMGTVTKCADAEDVIVGKHGLIIRKGEKQGLLLPQVPVEWEWDRETFLEQACLKAGLPRTAWHDPGTEIFWFQSYHVV